MNIEEAVSWWWSVLVPIAYVIAYYGGYLASIRNEAEAWKTRTGEFLVLLAIACVSLAANFTPELPTGYGLIAFLAWSLTLTCLSIPTCLGFQNRRAKSKNRVQILP
jgi:hypothetical protein